MLKKTSDIEIDTKDQEMVYCVNCLQLKHLSEFKHHSKICITCKEKLKDEYPTDQSS